MVEKATLSWAVLVMVRYYSNNGAVAFDERLVYNALRGHYGATDIADELERLLEARTTRISRDQDLDEPFDLLELVA